MPSDRGGAGRGSQPATGTGASCPASASRPTAATPHVAINDLVVVRKGANQVVIGIHVDDELYVRFAGDGVVLSTPLGSSAYTMAAGGPILAAGTEAIVVTPVAAARRLDPAARRRAQRAR